MLINAFAPPPFNKCRSKYVRSVLSPLKTSFPFHFVFNHNIPSRNYRVTKSFLFKWSFIAATFMILFCIQNNLRDDEYDLITHSLSSSMDLYTKHHTGWMASTGQTFKFPTCISVSSVRKLHHYALLNEEAPGGHGAAPSIFICPPPPPLRCPHHKTRGQKPARNTRQEQAGENTTWRSGDIDKVRGRP